MAEEGVAPKDDNAESDGGIKVIIKKITSSKKMMIIAGGGVLLLLLIFDYPQVKMGKSYI